MATPTLVVLAAGMGSRYGGLKQVDPVGPNGETIIDYSIYDAIRAGFGKIVFVVRRDIEAAFRETFGRKFEKRVAVEYVFQELDCLPVGFSVPPERRKPWGTGHAVLVAEPGVREPFAVVSADDFCGADSFRLLADHLKEAHDDASGVGDWCMVGFTLRNTLSDHGTVSRALCRMDVEGYLHGVEELTRIEKAGKGARYTDALGQVHPLTGDETVSLIMWGFTPSVFTLLRDELDRFLRARGDDPQAEFFLPDVVDRAVSLGHARMKVLPTSESWFGVTYREDRPRVIDSIGRLIESGVYPEKLW
ncbi:NTP transferase domain-containing protein [Candidatus Sumerlaeota bacterium]|nr:NTP transferase domain-containing protein [Candidatus Sumerlaeota bacterium]